MGSEMCIRDSFDGALSASEKVAVQDGNPLAGHINLLEEAFKK